MEAGSAPVNRRGAGPECDGQYENEGASIMKGPPKRHWRSYGNEELPTGTEALDEPFAAFPSWFLRITCDRCGKVRMVNEAHVAWHDRTLRTILGRMRHDGCGGLAGTAVLLTGIEGVSSRPVRRIVLITQPTLRAAPPQR